MIEQLPLWGEQHVLPLPPTRRVAEQSSPPQQADALMQGLSSAAQPHVPFWQLWLQQSAPALHEPPFGLQQTRPVHARPLQQSEACRQAP